MLFAEIIRWKNILKLFTNFLIENLVQWMFVSTSIMNHENELIIMKNSFYFVLHKLVWNVKILFYSLRVFIKWELKLIMNEDK
jgi:hypothetical protein